MQEHKLRIGLVGASPRKSWASLSHIPALKLLPAFELTAVATSSEASAQEAAKAFQVAEAFSSAIQLARSPNVDLVSVCVKVPYHQEIVTAALAAGKHVLCEWPLAVSVEEADAMRRQSEAAGVHTAVGLQARMNPAVRRAHDLIAGGLIGQPLTASVLSTTEGHGAALPSAYAYMCDPANGATMSTILTGHTLDLAIYLLGGIESLQAMTTIKFPQVRLTDVGGHVARLTADSLSIQARFLNGCLLTAEIDGGRPAGTPFFFQVFGTKGSLALRGGHPYGFQAGDLLLEASIPFQAPDLLSAPEFKGPLTNVGELYARLALDLLRQEHIVPDFAHAVQLHQLIRSVGIAAETGVRETAGQWPIH